MPAVPIGKLKTPDILTSLEDGRKVKSLACHFAAACNIIPDKYSTKWGVPNDYPIMAPSYAAARSELANNTRLDEAARKHGSRLTR